MMSPCACALQLRRLTHNAPAENASFPGYAEDLRSACVGAGGGAISSSDAPSAAALSAAARAAAVVLVGGSVPEVDPATGALYNTCLVFDGGGGVIAKHRKLHLFDIDIPGGITFRESDTLSPGEDVTVVDTAVGRLGIGARAWSIAALSCFLACADATTLRAWRRLSLSLLSLRHLL
jgi:omega-amidase